jgi:uncharacterized protein (TIGR02466 family)
MSDLLNLFPLSVLRDRIELATDYREDLIARILTMRESHPEKTKGATWTGDVNGYEYLHRDEAFEPLFQKLAQPVRGYLAALALDAAKFRVHFTRSWATVSLGSERIAPHRHEQSHLSLSYYLKKPAQSGALRFHQQNPPNQFMPRLLSPRMMEAGIAERHTPLNATVVSLDPAEGEVVIFPSQTEHSTMPNLGNEPRISIAIDIVVTLRDSAHFDAGLPDPSTWKRY